VVLVSTIIIAHHKLTYHKDVLSLNIQPRENLKNQFQEPVVSDGLGNCSLWFQHYLQ